MSENADMIKNAINVASVQMKGWTLIGAVIISEQNKSVSVTFSSGKLEKVVIVANGVISAFQG